MKRNCPHCNKKFSWWSQVTDWMSNYGEDWLEFALLMIICPHCSEYAGEVDFMESKIEAKEIKVK